MRIEVMLICLTQDRNNQRVVCTVYNSFNIMKLLEIKSFCSAKSFNSLLKCRNQTCKLSNAHSTSSAAGEKPNKQPDFIETRSNLFDKLKAEYDAKLKTFVTEPIKIKLKDGTIQEGRSWQSTPYQIYDEINKKLATEAIVAKVNNQLWDLNRPLESDCELELLKFDDPGAEQVFWHSSAHVLGAAVEVLYGCLLRTGPATETGFFYDVFDPDEKVSLCNFCIQKIKKEKTHFRHFQIHLKFFGVIEKEMAKITQSRQSFERIEVSKEDLMELFCYNRFKMEIIEKKIGDRGTVYRCGSLVDLCSGPHIKHTGKIKSFKLINVRFICVLEFSKIAPIYIGIIFISYFSWARIYHRTVLFSSVDCMVLHFQKVTA